MSIETLRDDLHDRIEQGLQPLIRVLARLGILPNQVTFAGAVLSLVTAGLIAAGWLFAAGLVWLAAGAMDLLDGALARSQDKATGSGAFLDSTLDRISEGVVFAAIAYYLAERGEPIAAGLTVLALLGSLAVSYTRARAEALGARCNVGLVTRAERVLLLALGLCLDLLPLVIYLLVVLTAITVGQRVRHTMRQLHQKA